MTSAAEYELIDDGVYTPQTHPAASALLVASEYFVIDVSTFASLVSRRDPVGILTAPPADTPNAAPVTVICSSSRDPVRAARSIRHPQQLPPHPRIHHPPHRRRQDTTRNPPLHQGIHRPRALPPAHPVNDTAHKPLTNIEASGGNGEGDSPLGSGEVSPLVHGCEGLRDDLGHHVRLQEGEEVVSVHDADVAELGA